MSERIEGMVDKLSSADNYGDVDWLLGAPVENIALSVVDDTMRSNVEFQGKAGLPAMVSRYTTPGGEKWPCDFCTGLEGDWIYPNVPEDVWHRHERCRCIIEYTPAGSTTTENFIAKDVRQADGKVKKYWESADKKTLQARKKTNSVVRNIQPTNAIKEVERMAISKGQLEVVPPQKLYTNKPAKFIVDNPQYQTHKIDAVKGVVNEFGGTAEMFTVKPDAMVYWNGDKWFYEMASTEITEGRLINAWNSINDIKGGIILDISAPPGAPWKVPNADKSLKEIINVLNTSTRESVDIILVKDGQVVSVRQYVKV